MTMHHGPTSSPFLRFALLIAVATAGLTLPGNRPALAASNEPVLDRFAGDAGLDSPLNWLARAEKLAGQWGTESQRSYALADLAAVLADAGQIEPAEAIAGRLDPGTGVLVAHKALVAAYARSGKLDKAEATARLSVEPDGRPEPGAYCEFQCLIADALAKTGRTDDAEKVLARLDNPPSDWPVEWEPPASLPAIRARIHSALAVAYFKADRRSDYERHIAEAERAAAGIPGDVNRLWTQMLFSSVPPEDQGSEDRAGEPPVDPMNAIYKSQAITAAVVARGEVGDFEAARKTLETLPTGRHRDVIIRRLIEAMIRAGAVDQARRQADTIETDDHRGLAYLALVPAYIKADNLSEAAALARKIDYPDSRLLAQIQLALATGGSGESGSLKSLMASAMASAGQEAAAMEAQQRLPQGDLLPSMSPLRADTCREAAHILAKAYSHEDLLAWIESLPAPDARYSALLGVGETLLANRAP